MPLKAGMGFAFRQSLPVMGKLAPRPAVSVGFAARPATGRPARAGQSVSTRRVADTEHGGWKGLEGATAFLPGVVTAVGCTSSHLRRETPGVVMHLLELPALPELGGSPLNALGFPWNYGGEPPLSVILSFTSLNWGEDFSLRDDRMKSE